MTKCPAILQGVCEWLPNYESAEVVSFLFALLVVVIFAIDHYKVPTYAKTTIGYFIELAPESLTSRSRYSRGLYVYIALMLVFYAVLLILGPTALKPAASYLGIKLGENANGAVWPLTAASLIALLGSGNDKYLGRLEAWLRSIAHEAAYIPDSVVNLSSALDGSFPLTEEELRTTDDLTPEIWALVQNNQEGSWQSWFRAKYLYSRLEYLRRDDQFKQLMRQPENERAFEFVIEKRDALKREIGPDSLVELSESIIAKIDAFKNALAVFLASLLWRGCDTENAVAAKLAALKLNIGPAQKLTSTFMFMFHVLVWLAVTALVWMAVFAIRNLQWHDPSIGQKWYLTLSFFVFLLTAFFIDRWRESRLVAGEWKYTYDVILPSTIICSFGIGTAAAVLTFAIHQGGVWRFFAMLLVAFAMTVPMAFLFQLLMRWAAKSPPTSKAAAAGIPYARDEPAFTRMAAWAGALYGGIAFLLILGVLYWLAQFWIVMSTPQQIIDAASDQITRIQAAYNSPKQEDRWFVNSAPGAAVRKLGDALGNARRELDENQVGNSTINDIVSKCDSLGDLGGGNRVFNDGCELNTPFTIQQPSESGVLQSLAILQDQIGALKQSYRNLQNYGTLMAAVKYEWRNALLVSFIWASMAAGFAISILLYRRYMLWDNINPRKLSDYMPPNQQNVGAWLRTPLHDIGNLSPLEALRYPAFRSRLADYSRTRAPEAERPELRVVA